MFVLHSIVLGGVYGGGGWVLMNSKVNVGFGLVLGCFVVAVSMKMHSFVATNLLLVDEMVDRRRRKGNGKTKREERGVEKGGNGYENGTEVSRDLSVGAGGRRGKVSEADVGNDEADIVSESREDSGNGKANDMCVENNTGRLAPFPSNVTLKNYIYYITLVPQLVYETRYPRTKRINKSHFLLHCLTIVLCLLVQHGVLTQFMVPVFRNQRQPQPLWFLVAKLAIPSFTVWLLFFFQFFHSFLNALAEIARLSDRCFYLDWWNATTLDSFWRKWNIAVHEWCLRHLVIEPVTKFEIKPVTAAFATFLISALLHEYVFIVGFKIVRPYMFLGMLIQVPLIRLTQMKRYKGKRRGNLLMWILLFLGQPLIELLYFREYFQRHTSFFCND